MSFDTSWDVELYKTEYESDEHWKLRRDFMMVHKDKFPEERLVCLAQVFFNVEFLGCKYPDKTMILVEELSKDIAADHREQQKSKLQRTFVKASDAAGARIKGKPRSLDEGQSTSKSNFETSNVTNEAKILKIKPENVNNPEVILNSFEINQFKNDTVGNRFQMSTSSLNSYSNKRRNNFQVTASKLNYETSTVNDHENISLKEIKETNGPLGNIVLFYKQDEHPCFALRRTAHQWSKSCSITALQDPATKLWTCTCEISNIQFSEYSHQVKAQARKIACQIAFERLMEYYFTVKIKCDFCGGDEVVNTTGKVKVNDNNTIESSVSKLNVNEEIKEEAGSKNIEEAIRKNDAEASVGNVETVDLDTPLGDDNIGTKLLKMMGWSGGGLGKNEQGISEPIKPADQRNRRAGFGLSQKAQNKLNNGKNPNFNNIKNEKDLFAIKKIIKDYRYSSELNDLVFSSDFTKEQRAVLHLYAQKLGLKTKSYGGKKKANRHLVISKKINNWTIIEGIVKNVSVFYNKYELLRPGEKMLDKNDQLN